MISERDIAKGKVLVSACAIIEGKDHEVLLIYEGDMPYHKWWVLPGGYVRPDETVEQTVVREIEEETGLEIASTKLIGLYEYFFTEKNEPINHIIVPSLVASEGEVDAEYLSEEEKEFQNLHNALIDSNFKQNSPILVESKILHGDPADKIVKYANEIDADLIIMGSKGQGKLANVLLGSVSEHVARHSKRSVLIVKKKNKE